MDNVTTGYQEGGLRRKAAAVTSVDDGDIGNVSPTRRRFRRDQDKRRQRHSAPDLSFGGNVDTALLQAYQKSLELERINERPLRSYGKNSAVAVP